MNKIIVSSSKININNNNYLTSIDKYNHNLEINIQDDSKVIFYKLNYVTSDTKIDINIHNRCQFELNLLLINTGNNTFTLNINMLNNDSFCKIKTRILNTLNDKIHFICNGKILENTFNNELIEDLKGLITSADEITISPNIEALTSELNANHLVTIGSIPKEELFYLNSKTLSNEESKRMLIESFMSEVANNLIKSKIKMEVITLE